MVETDKVQQAIDIIRDFEKIALQKHDKGYYVCISGGKDSSVIQHLCVLAGVRCEFVHNLTTVDYPETVRFIRAEQARVRELGYTFEVQQARFSDGKVKTMWNLIAKKGFPTRIARWCCEHLKEYGGEGRYCITGVRWAESVKRKTNRATHEVKGSNIKTRIMLNNDNDAKRKFTESCGIKRSLILNPIIAWSDTDVWDFINEFKLPYNPLYDKGFKRIGCCGCPMGRKAKEEFAANPKYAAAYRKAGARYLEYLERKPDGYQLKGAYESPEKYFEWWVSGKGQEIQDENQISFEDY